MSFRGKMAVVTGSTTGIDFAISKEFAENNEVTVIVCSRSIQKAERAAQQTTVKLLLQKLIDITSNSSVNSFW